VSDTEVREAREEPGEVPVRNPDARKAQQIAVVGKKGEGKTELSFLLFDSYPGPKLAIDPNGDLKMPENTLRLELPLPHRWPTAQFPDEKRQVALFVPDPGSPTFLDDVDQAVGLAYAHRGVCLFVDECHDAFPSTGTKPHGRRALRQGRHHDLTGIYADLRPMRTDPLVIANADWVYMFKLKNPADRRRCADSIGWNPKDFDDAMEALGPFEYLRYDDEIDDLAHFPPLPEELLKHHKS
jgi:hypothetical protein